MFREGGSTLVSSDVSSFMPRHLIAPPTRRSLRWRSTPMRLLSTSRLLSSCRCRLPRPRNANSAWHSMSQTDPTLPRARDAITRGWADGRWRHARDGRLQPRGSMETRAVAGSSTVRSVRIFQNYRDGPEVMIRSPSWSFATKFFCLWYRAYWWKNGVLALTPT